MIKKLFNEIVYFNKYSRDRWVKNRADEIPANSKVLDMAAGNCPYRNAFKHCVYLAQDFAQLEPHQLRGNKDYGELNYICDATKVPEADGAFDAIICTEALEHVPEPILVIREISRLLRPGGRLLLTAPLGSGLHQEPFHYYGGFTPYWYNKFLHENSFIDIVVSANAGTYKHFGQESIRIAKISTPWKLSSPLMIKIIWAPFWLALLPVLIFIVPVFCHLIDRYDEDKKFTIGYHVSATKA